MQDITPLEKALQLFESIAEQTRSIRKESIDKLRDNIKTLRLDPDNDKAMMTEAKLAVITTLSGLLKDQEASAMANAKMQLTRKESENNEQAARAVASMLQLITKNDVAKTPVVQDISEFDNKLDKKFSECDLDITEDELEACGTLPTGAVQAEVDATSQVVRPAAE